MESALELANRSRELLLNGTWISGTNWKKELDHTDLGSANQAVLGSNSIALLAQHLHYYISGLIEFLEGGELRIRDQFSFDHPDIRTEEEWISFRQRFYLDATHYIELIGKLDEAGLSAPFFKPEYGDYRRNIEAMIEHGYYHLGQVVLIRKMLARQS